MSIQYSILVNGNPGETFTPSRRLRQGDSLSSYLFLICVEGFSSLMDKAKRQGELKGLRVAKGSTQISHFHFAVYCVLFSKASREEWLKMEHILTTYGKGSGQVLNKEKPFILFSPYTKTRNINFVIQAIRSTNCGSYEKYLGLLTMIGRSKYNTFKNIKESVKNDK